MTTATETPETATSGEVLVLPLDHCLPNPWNKERALDEPFLESLRDKGQQVIALVRPHPEREGFYEIVFGARRQKGLLEIGRRTWRAEVREMTDAEAEELCAIENAQRRGLSWQQQCEHIEGYLKRHQDEDAPARIASALGITTASVKRRARLLSKLSKSWKESIKKEELPAWTADHFETLTVLSEEDQEDLHDDIGYEANGITLKDLREQLARDMQALKSAPWKLDDDTLDPKAGSCNACPKRTGVNTDLFEEVDGKAKKGDRCLDKGCFAAKMKAHLVLKEAKLREEHPNLVKVSREYSSEPGVLKSYQFEAAKKSDKGALPALVIDGGGAGTLTWIKPDKDSRASATIKKAEGGGKTPLKDRKAALEKRRTSAVIAKLIDWVEAKDLEWPAGDFNLMVAIIHVFGTDNQDTYKTTRFGWAGVKKWTKTPPTPAELWPRVMRVLVGQLHSQLHRDKPSLVEAKEIAAIVSADLEAFRKEAEEEIPTPKSWANEEAAERMAGGKKSKAAKLDRYDGVAEDPDMDEDEGLDGDSEGDI